MLESQSLFAFTEAANNNHWLFGLGLGGTNRSLPNATNVGNNSPVPAPYNQDIYSIASPSTKVLIALLGGYQWSRLNDFLPYYSLALHYEHQFNSSIKGTVEQYALPQFINYNYSMKLNSSILDLLGKINLFQFNALLPYLSAGIGAAFNHVSNYKEQPIPSVNPARISPAYGSKTSARSAYTFGAGLDYLYDRNLWLTLGYEYWNLGTVSSNPGQSSWSNTNLHFGPLETNTVFGRITFLF